MRRTGEEDAKVIPQRHLASWNVGLSPVLIKFKFDKAHACARRGRGWGGGGGGSGVGQM